MSVVLVCSSHARERNPEDRVYAVVEAGRPLLGQQHLSIRSHSADPEWLSIVGVAIEPQAVSMTVRHDEVTVDIRYFYGEGENAIAEACASALDLVVEELAEHSRVQHQPSTCASLAMSASTS